LIRRLSKVHKWPNNQQSHRKLAKPPAGAKSTSDLHFTTTYWIRIVKREM